MADDERLLDVAARLDAARFVGRADALAVVEDLLRDVSATRILYVHGSAGIGKSAFLREIGRRVTAIGRPVLRLDGRVLAPVPELLAAAVEPARTNPGTVLILDEVDELASVRFELRDLVLTLPAGTVVVLASRVRAAREWFDDELGQVTVELGLRPLDPTEASSLLARHGVTDPVRTEALVEWAGGYPLALTVAATTAESTTVHMPGPRVDLPTEDGPLAQVILDRLAGHELDDIDPLVLDVAAVAPAVDARLLAAVLPGRPTRAALAQLRQLSVAEHVGRRTTLHRLVRHALRTQLRSADPERYRRLVLQVAEHLRARALTGEPELLFALSDLIEDADFRLAFGASTTHYADRPHPGDADVVADRLGARDTQWWGRFARWCEERPEFVVTVRRATGELAAVGIVGSVDRFPAACEDEIEVGPVLRVVRAAGHSDGATVAHGFVILEDQADRAAWDEVTRVGNTAIVTRSGVGNPRYLYVTDHERRAGDGTQLFDYEVLPELNRFDGERVLFTMMVDLGPEGAVGQVMALIRAEQGLTEPVGASTRGVALVAALRSFHDDDVMARSTLGTGHGGDRATAARAEVRSAIDAAFTSSEADQLLRVALERTYLDRDGGHVVAQEELFMSRSSFYRHLQRARDQLVERSQA